MIFNNPLLVMEEFVDLHLIEFIRNELNMTFLALKLEKWQQSGEDPDELLCLILSECDYYNASEVNRFRQEVAAYRKMSQPEFGKARADYLFMKKQYGKAVADYERILEYMKSSKGHEEFLAKVYNNLGSSYARLFLTDKAYHAYVKSFELVSNKDVLSRIYYLSKWNPALEVKERFQTLLTEELKAEADLRMDNADEAAENAESLQVLEELFSKDPIKRLAGAGEIIQRWKMEYRNMV